MFASGPAACRINVNTENHDGTLTTLASVEVKPEHLLMQMLAEPAMRSE